VKNKVALNKTPELLELERKKADLLRLEAELAEAELELITLTAELSAFERQYLDTIGVKYAELDALEANIAKEKARSNPDDPRLRERVYQAQARARESSDSVAKEPGLNERNRFEPSDELRKLYRAVTKAIHPDLATDEEERKLRTRLMVEANLAYERGDVAGLKRILSEWGNRPEAITGEGVASELVRVIRKIDQIQRRLDTIKTETINLTDSDLYRLMVRVTQANKEGRDLLKEMSAKLDDDIAHAHIRLTKLTQKRKRKTEK
jgi:hypothetical protein